MSLPTGDDILDFITYRNAVEEGEYQPDVHPDPDLLDDDCGAFVEIGGTVSLGGATVTDNKDLVEERWLRIPIHGVEQWINKDGPASMNRTTKVVAFNEPTLGGEFQINTFLDEILGISHDEITLDKYVNKTLGTSYSVTEFDFSSGTFVEGFLRGRVYFYDSELEEYKLTHHGYVSSYGPVDNPLLRKFYIYDPADLLTDIPVGKVFENPTVGDLIRFVLNGTDDTGTKVGINKVTPFDVTSVEFPSRDQFNSRTAGELFEQQARAEDDATSGFFNSAFELISDFISQPETRVAPTAARTKSFSRNRNNLVDVLNYIASLINGRWYFSPRQDGIALQIRSNNRNTDYGRTFKDQTQDVDDEDFSLEVKENTALSDIKPINTVVVNGEKRTALDIVQNEDVGLGLRDRIQSLTEQYPYAKVRYEPFYQAAGEQELGPTNVRGDATDLKEAEFQAYKEFIKHIEETTEGRVETFGDPMPLPYDFIQSRPACAGNAVDDAQPILYSINDVHHRRYAGEPYITELGVHAEVRNTDENFTYTSEYRQAQ
jgi:hypothetical protein